MYTFSFSASIYRFNQDLNTPWSQSYVYLSVNKPMGKHRHLGVHDASCHSQLDSLLTAADGPKSASYLWIIKEKVIQWVFHQRTCFIFCGKLDKGTMMGIVHFFRDAHPSKASDFDVEGSQGTNHCNASPRSIGLQGSCIHTSGI